MATNRAAALLARRPLSANEWPVRAALSVPAAVRLPRYVSHPHEPLSEARELMRSEEERDGMRQAGRLARAALELAKGMIRAGVTTEQIDDAVHTYIVEQRAYPSPLRYKGFPRSCCTSVNEVVAHGIPNARPLQPGDKINVDVTVYTGQGYHGDCSETLVVPGDDDPVWSARLAHLVDAARDATQQGIAACGPGVLVRAIGAAIDACARQHGYRVYPNLTGHGIGRTFHTEPWIVPTPAGVYPPLDRLQPGQCLTVEPILSSGRVDLDTWDDGWTLVAKDRSLSAQFEQTLLITDQGYEILTC